MFGIQGLYVRISSLLQQHLSPRVIQPAYNNSLTVVSIRTEMDCQILNLPTPQRKLPNVNWPDVCNKWCHTKSMLLINYIHSAVFYDVVAKYFWGGLNLLI